jgi:hypothetical protein
MFQNSEFSKTESNPLENRTKQSLICSKDCKFPSTVTQSYISLEEETLNATNSHA